MGKTGNTNNSSSSKDNDNDNNDLKLHNRCQQSVTGKQGYGPTVDVRSGSISAGPLYCQSECNQEGETTYYFKQKKCNISKY